MSDGEITWESRKSKVREKYQAWLDKMDPRGRTTEAETPTTPETPGSVPSKAVTGADPSAKVTAPPSPTSDTSATATAPPATSASRLASTTPAVSTNSNFAKSTVWTLPLIGWHEQNSRKTIVEPNGSLVPGLSEAARSSLLRLATGTSQPVEEIVYQIASWFVEAEDERAEGPLGDAVEFYCANYIL